MCLPSISDICVQYLTPSVECERNYYMTCNQGDLKTSLQKDSRAREAKPTAARAREEPYNWFIVYPIKR